MKPTFALFILVSGFLVSGSLSFADSQTTHIRRTEAEDITALVGISNGVLEIRGYVTERSGPPVLFDQANFDDGSGPVDLPVNVDLFTRVVTALEENGIHPIRRDGGSVLITLRAQVNCSLSTFCTVDDAP